MGQQRRQRQYFVPQKCWYNAPRSVRVMLTPDTSVTVAECVIFSVRIISYHRITRNKGLSVRQYYEFVGGTFDLRSKWEQAVADAGLDAVG